MISFRKGKSDQNMPMRFHPGQPSISASCDMLHPITCPAANIYDVACAITRAVLSIECAGGFMRHDRARKTISPQKTLVGVACCPS